MLRKYILNNLKNAYTPNGLSFVFEVEGNTVPPLLRQALALCPTVVFGSWDFEKCLDP